MSVILFIYCCALLVISRTYKYYFIVERTTGTTIFHPMLPYPSVDEEDEPISVPIRLLEKDAESEGILSSMLRFDESKYLILGPYYSTCIMFFVTHFSADIIFIFKNSYIMLYKFIDNL